MANTPNIVKAIGNKFASTLAGSLSNSATTTTVADGTGLSATGGYMIIDEAITAKREIIYVESVSSNTLTIATDGRGRCGTSAVAHDSGAVITDVIVDEHINGIAVKYRVEHGDDGTHNTTYVVTPTATQTLTNKTLTSPVLNSPTVNTPTLILADTSPTADGSMGFDRTGEDLQVGDGSASQIVHMGAWTSFDPTVSNITLGTGGTKVGYYSQVGKTVFCRVIITLGTSGDVTDIPTLTLPVAIKSASIVPIGQCGYVDTGTQTYIGYMDGNGVFRLYYVTGNYLTLNNVNATQPFDWTATDILFANITYEAS